MDRSLSFLLIRLSEKRLEESYALFCAIAIFGPCQYRISKCVSFGSVSIQKVRVFQLIQKVPYSERFVESSRSIIKRVRIGFSCNGQKSCLGHLDKEVRTLAFV